MRVNPPKPDPCLVSLQTNSGRRGSEKLWKKARNCPLGCTVKCKKASNE